MHVVDALMTESSDFDPVEFLDNKKTNTLTIISLSVEPHYIYRSTTDRVLV